MTSAAGPEVTEHRIELDDIRMHYRTAGEGEPLVLLHGFPETSHAWRKVMPGLARHFRVVAPDLRGCGQTDRPDSGYDKKTVAADVAQLVGRLGLGRINLVGHDVGMMVAYEYAAANREQVLRLALMEAALPGLGLEDLFDPLTFPRMYHLPLFDAPNGLAEALITGREQMFVAHFMLQQAYGAGALDEDSLTLYGRSLAAPGCLHAGIAYFRAHKIDAVRNREHARRKLDMPVLTVGATASFGAHLEPEIRPLAEQLHPVMVECGHYLAEERPGELTRILLDFFGDSSDSRSGEPAKAGGR